MSGPIIPADRWPEWADRLCFDKSGAAFFFGACTFGHRWESEAEPAGIEMPAGWDWRVPVMRHQPAPAIDLEQFREAVESLRLGATRAEHHEECDRLLALIDGHDATSSPVAQRKLRELQAEGYIVNGVAIFNPTTGRRGLVDYLGYVGWQTSEQPTKGEGA